MAMEQEQGVVQPPIQQEVLRDEKPVERLTEKVFKQADVDNIVKRAKQDAIDSFRRQLQEQPQYVQQKYGEPSKPSGPASSFSQEDIRKFAAEEAQRLRDEWVEHATRKAQDEEAQRIVRDFSSKLDSGRGKYSDFDEMVGDIDYQYFPNIVQMIARDLDNADDVLYELGKNRTKMASLEYLAERSPRDALREAKRLAKSIKENQEAEKSLRPREPLSQVKSSSASVDSGDRLSFKDLRNKYRA